MMLMMKSRLVLKEKIINWVIVADVFTMMMIKNMMLIKTMTKMIMIKMMIVMMMKR